MEVCIIKVGRKIKEKESKIYSYHDVKYDDDGWADASKYLPLDFDLVYLKAVDRKEVIRGWHCHNVWDGYKLKDKEKILYWKKDKDESM